MYHRSTDHLARCPCTVGRNSVAGYLLVVCFVRGNCGHCVPQLEYDSRWQVLLPMYIRMPSRQSQKSWPDGCSLKQRAEATLNKAIGKDKGELHEEPSRWPSHCGESAAPKRPRLESHVDSNASYHPAPQPHTSYESVAIQGHSFKDGRTAHKDLRGNTNCSTDVRIDRCPPLNPHTLQHAKGTLEQQTQQGNTESTSGERPQVDIVGCITTYAFFALAGGERLRISQVLVLPHHQGKGTKRNTIEHVHWHSVTNCMGVRQGFALLVEFQL